MAVQLLNDTWYEIIDDESPSTITFGATQNTAYVTYLIDPNEILDFINDVLGYAYLFNNSYIKRITSASHPLFPWLYAYKIFDIKGTKPNGKEQTILVRDKTTLKKIDAVYPPYVGSYEYLKVTVQYMSRNYAIYTDEQLKPFWKENQKYYMPTYSYRKFGNNPAQLVVGEREETFTDRYEYGRYTNFSFENTINLLTYGNSNFWMKFGPQEIAFDLGKEKPIVQDSGGAQNLKICKTFVDWNWYFVPYEFTINNKNWVNGYSKINSDVLYELAFPGGDVVQPLFNIGTLLFDRVETKKYEPYYPFEQININFDSSVPDYFKEYNKNQYADVKFKLIWFQYPDELYVPPNRNMFNTLQCKDFTSPHNTLLSPTDLKYYYIESSPALINPPPPPAAFNFVPNVSGTPVFFSYAFGNLFNYIQGQ